METKPSYYAIIPAEVRYDKDLKPNAKLLYGEITCLCGKEGYCWASNSYFAELYEVSNETVSRWINQLIKKGYISSDIIYKENSKEIKGRRLYVKSIPIDKKIKTCIDEKVKDNNINNNNINILYSDSKKASKKETLEKAYNEIFNHWNSKNIQQHKELTEPIKKAIKKAMDTYKDIEVIKEAITRYDEMLNSDYKYCSYKWTLEKFLKQDNALPDFMDEGSKWINYTASKPKPVTEASTSPEDDSSESISFNDLSVEDTFKLLKEIKK